MTLYFSNLVSFLPLIRLIIGGQDGSVTFLVVAHNTTPEQLDESRTILRRLPSRKRQKRHYDEDNKENKVSKVRLGLKKAGLSMGDDIMAVCLDFCSTNVVQLSNRNPYFYQRQCHYALITQLSLKAVSKVQTGS